jgi:hypothetical protein
MNTPNKSKQIEISPDALLLKVYELNQAGASVAEMRRTDAGMIQLTIEWQQDGGVEGNQA